MSSQNQVTIILEDGQILKEKARFLEKKTVLQILHSYNRDDNIILSLRTPTLISILEPNEIPLDKYPELKTKKTKGDEFTIPNLSLFCLKKEDGGKVFQNFLVFQPIDESDESIKFPPFIYGFSKIDQTRSILSILKEMTAKFYLKIKNPSIFLDDKEVSNFIIKNFIKYAESKKNLQKIWFKFTITEEGKKQIKERQFRVKEMIDYVGRFCRDIIQFLNQVGKKVQDEHVFTEFEYKTIFGTIPEIFNACTRLNAAFEGNYSYDSYLGNIFLKSIPDLEENFKEFYANYIRKDLIPEILKRHENNKLLESIVHQTFEKSAIDFDSMAIMPIQILPKYKTLLSDIIKLTPQSHPEFHLLKRSSEELDNTIKNLEDYCSIREVSYLQNRMIPLEKYKYQPLDSNNRFLVNKYNVNYNIRSKSTVYLMNDLIVFTKSADGKEIEKFRYKLDEFIFIPNYKQSMIIYYHKKNFDVFKFQSVESMVNLVENINQYRQTMFDSAKNSSLLVSEILIKENFLIPPMIDSSCCKIKSLIIAASYGTYVTYDTNNKSMNVFRKVKNVHSHAKVVAVENYPYAHIYGGEKYPNPLEFAGEKFVELNPKTAKSSDILSYVYPCESPEGRIYHTVCTYKNYIVIYGGYKNERRKMFSCDVYFVNVETNEWFCSRPGFSQEPEPRYKHSAVVYRNTMIIHGGINCKNQTILNDTWCFNFDNGEWKIIDIDSKNSAAVVPRFGHAAVMVNQFMFIIGGLTNSNKNIREQIVTENSEDSVNSNNEEEDDDDDLQNIEDCDDCDDCNQFMPATNCFSYNVKTDKLFGVNVIGNFLPGLSMFSAVYDDTNEQIIIFGGRYLNNKFEKHSPIFIKMSVPNYFSTATDNTEDTLEPGRKMKRKLTQPLFLNVSGDLKPKNSQRDIKSSHPKTGNNNIDDNHNQPFGIRPQPSTPNPKRIALKININEEPKKPHFDKK